MGGLLIRGEIHLAFCLNWLSGALVGVGGSDLHLSNRRAATARRVPTRASPATAPLPRPLVEYHIIILRSDSIVAFN